MHLRGGADAQLDSKAVANLEKWYEADYRFIELCSEWVAKHAPETLA